MGVHRVTGIVQELESILGRGKVYDDPAVVALYSREPSGLEGFGLAVVFPETAEDVSRLAAWAYRRMVPLYPQGSTTSLSGSAVPENGVIVSFERMNRILEVSVLDSVAVVEPGVRIAELNLELARYQHMFPVDPASQAVATVGGAINSGAGGMKGAKYGTMRDWVNQLEIVLADENGTRMTIGCRTVKCRQGYDLVRLIVGSEGTLALVTRAVLRITPLPEAAPTVLGFFDNLGDLVDAFLELRSAGVQPLLAEFLDARTVSIARRGLPGFENVEGHMLLVSVEANREAVERIQAQLVKVFESHGAHGIRVAGDLGEAEEKGLLALRRRLLPAQLEYSRRYWGAPRVQVFIEDIVVPPSRLVEAVEMLNQLTEDYGLPMVLGGHIGDGNLHPAVGFDPGDPGAASRVHAWFTEVMKLAVKLGGSVSAEHGVGMLKREGLRIELERLGSLKALELMKAIKRLFDPHNVLNPGKLF
ncbi:FAD-binding oxidoreductase [Hyperthermus butylicus]|uniref:Dehydrogenase n=1 Tax=Hyperthermus butylicus (strain DSM 5456 / JCM 9403 / PLM1-5) TaxID=415426 RepID=A2BMS3_HYPBU|nr:FAD-linked oxidase C-terminal domain-containing protein [Hyperthermus butylicus]ABM81284.1 dehydrogenase [Hyperthermus butylicus DSM 5456]